jgi:hypothetical protein
MAQVATKALAMNPARLEVIATFRTRDPQLEAIDYSGEKIQYLGTIYE